MLEVVEEAVDKIEEAAAVAEEVVLEEVAVLVSELEEDVLEVVVALGLVVAVLVLPIAEVTTVKIDPASDRRELNIFCPAAVDANKANGNTLEALILIAYPKYKLLVRNPIRICFEVLGVSIRGT